MRYFVASDIHGSAYWAPMMMERFNEEKCDRMLLFGDILYHGPRNDLPRDYDPKKVIALLNPIADKIVAVRGNCDSEVDQMVLNFDIMTPFMVFVQPNGVNVFATHGHVYTPDKPHTLAKGGVFLGGHTHIAGITSLDELTYINPGSVSIPKNDTKNGYAIMDEKKIILKELETSKVIGEYSWI